MKKKLLATLALTLVLCLLPATALAATYIVDDGDITVTRKADGKQYVQQGTRDAVEDEAPVLNGFAYNTVIRLVAVDEGGVVNVTLHNAVIWVSDSSDQSVIEVVGSTTANVVIEGFVELHDEFYWTDYDSAMIHVPSGTLNLSGSEEGDARLKLVGDRNGALIGSEEGEDFTGTIHLNNLMVYVEGDGDGALIGSGEDGNFNGKVVVGSDAMVSFCNDSNTVIGQGEDATESTGTIILEDNAKVCGDFYDEETGLNHDLVMGGGDNIKIQLSDSAILNSNTGAEVKAGEAKEDIEITGTLVEEIGEPTEVYYAQGEAFRVVDKDGNAVPYEMTLEDGVLTITAPKGAKLTGALEDMQLLSTKGATELRFGTSVLPIAELYHGVGMQGDTVVLTKNGKLTIGGADYSSLLK